MDGGWSTVNGPSGSGANTTQPPRQPLCTISNTHHTRARQTSMRLALVIAVAALLTAACSSNQPQTATTPPPPPATSAATGSSSTGDVLTWGGSGNSSGVYIQLGQPKNSPDPVIGVNGKPDPAQRYILVPVTAGNKSAGKARLSWSGRVGQTEAPPVSAPGDPVGELLPGEGGPFEQRFRVPAAAADLVVEVYATVDNQPAQGRLTFRGPLPSR